MAQPIFTWINPTTAAKTSAPFEATDAGSIIVSADALAGGETVELFVQVGNATVGYTNVVVAYIDGTPAVLTPTLPALCLEGGSNYVFVKSVTVGACGVYVVSKSQ
jgi:hypothetical protein